MSQPSCRRHAAAQGAPGPGRHDLLGVLAFVDDAGKLVPNDAPDAVANLALDWIKRTD